jgi:hypothetical protein
MLISDLACVPRDYFRKELPTNDTVEPQELVGAVVELDRAKWSSPLATRRQPRLESSEERLLDPGACSAALALDVHVLYIWEEVEVSLEGHCRCADNICECAAVQIITKQVHALDMIQHRVTSLDREGACVRQCRRTRSRLRHEADRRAAAQGRVCDPRRAAAYMRCHGAGGERSCPACDLAPELLQPAPDRAVHAGRRRPHRHGRARLG